MVGISINNQNRHEQCKTAVKTGAAAFAIGAAVNSAAEAISQKVVLSRPDEFMTNIESAVALRKKNCTTEKLGTQKMVDRVSKNLDKTLENAQNFIKNGKLNLKSIANAGAIGSLLTAVAVGIGRMIYAIYKGEKADNARILANELAKTNSDTTATINIEYTGARVEEDKEESIAAEDIDAETVAATMEVVADILEEEVAE